MKNKSSRSAAFTHTSSRQSNTSSRQSNTSLRQGKTSNSQGTVSDELFVALATRINATESPVLDILNSTNPHARGEFINDPTLERPRNTHDRLIFDDVQAKILAAAALESDIESAAKSGLLNTRQQRLLKRALEHNRHKNEFILANYYYNLDPTPENAHIHYTLNVSVYGRPDYNTFLALLTEQLEKIIPEELSLSDRAEYEKLLTLIGPLEKSTKIRFRPSAETFQRFSELAIQYFQPLFDYIPSDRTAFTPAEAAEITERIIRSIVPADSTWTAKYDPEGTTANVSTLYREIRFPGKRAAGDYTTESLKKIIVHELGTHMLHALPYEFSPVETLRMSLRHYEDFEEGTAKALEQAIDGHYADSGVTHYISIGLANFMGKDFREVFEIQKRLIHLTVPDLQAPDLQAFQTTQRAFRGTDRLPNNKDLVYFNGARMVWRYISRNLDSPRLFPNILMTKKIDHAHPTNDITDYLQP